RLEDAVFVVAVGGPLQRGAPAGVDVDVLVAGRLQALLHDVGGVAQVAFGEPGLAVAGARTSEHVEAVPAEERAAAERLGAAEGGGAGEGNRGGVGATGDTRERERDAEATARNAEHGVSSRMQAPP